MRNNVGAVAVLWACFFCRAALVQADHSVDFDTTFPSFGYSYDYAGHGDPLFAPIDDSDQVSSTYDVNTPPAAKATFDTSAWIFRRTPRIPTPALVLASACSFPRTSA